ncbi:MAG: helix-turn-helix transcriptional regulator [Bacteroidetes bacterium]|nr:helix-turn-helix transcriptional regulator [Bacteroidota bacterium]MBI3482240.1 helix-turn-helix transcriptional regulator [Bacteroidota bacterium]
MITDYLPTELLRPFIKTYKIVESHDEVVNRVLPNTSIAIAFRFKGQTNYITGNAKNSLSTSTITGLRKSVRLINYLKDSSTLVVLFKEIGAIAFFKEPLHELFEESVSLENFVNTRELSMVEEQLAEAQNNTQRVNIIDQFLLTKLYSLKSDKLISTAIQKVNLTNGNIKMKELAQSLYISTDAFEKRFRKIVGTSPKQFSSIVRLQSIISRGQKNQPLTNLALEAGFFDQSHFNKDFKLFSGQTPTDFFKSPFFW